MPGIFMLYLKWNYSLVLRNGTILVLFLTWSSLSSIFEPAHEIMARFVLRKLILQTRMSSDPVGLDVRLLVGPSSTSILHICEQRRLCRDCADADRLCDKYHNLMGWLISWKLLCCRVWKAQKCVCRGCTGTSVVYRYGVGTASMVWELARLETLG